MTQIPVKDLTRDKTSVNSIEMIIFLRIIDFYEEESSGGYRTK